MQELADQILELKNDKKISSKINKQLRSFKALGKKSDEGRI